MKTLTVYACDACGNSWNHLWEDERRLKMPCPHCDKKKNGKKFLYSSKFFRCETMMKTKGCGFVFASVEKDRMFIECPNCKVNQAKREAQVSHVRGEKGKNIMKATELAYGEAQKQGFSDMKDHGIKEGEICAPPINNAVTFAMEKMKMNNGWTGGTAVIPGMSHSDVGGNSELRNLQSGLMNGSIPDLIKTASKIE